MKNRQITFTTILLALGVLALSPIAQAVSPAPDGGYPGFNTAEGQNALLSLTTGVANTAVGWFSLWSNTDGSFNTGVGAGTLLFNVGDQSTGEGIQNTAIGAGALLNNTSGIDNTAGGAFALISNITGAHNTANGALALESNSDGSDNTATGAVALVNNSHGVQNTATGFQALAFNTTGSANTAIGVNALVNNTTGTNNTAIGTDALFNNTSGNNNIALGGGAGTNVVTASDTICIGTVGVNVTDGCYIGHVFEEPLDPDNLAMAIDVNGKVGTLPSSRRFKDDVQPMEKISEAILALRPVTFHYKNDKKCSPRFGLIAEEVAEVDPYLVALDKDGKPYSVRYDQVNAMLLNEFLKDHKKVQLLEAASAQERNDFEATIAELRKEIACVVAQSRDQDEKIQKVSAQVELKSPATNVVLDNR